MDWIDLALRIAGAMAAAAITIGGALWAVLRMMRKQNRQEQAEVQIYNVYKEMLTEIRQQAKDLQTDSFRQANELSRLAELVSKQTRMLIETESKVGRLTEDRDAMARMLAEIKRAQDSLMQKGELDRPLLDIPTNIFKHSGGR